MIYRACLVWLCLLLQVAESEQSTFTDLVKQLTANCISDLQKARSDTHRPHLCQLQGCSPKKSGERLKQYDTIRYDTRCYFNVRSKADISQLNLPHGTDN